MVCAVAAATCQHTLHQQLHTTEALHPHTSKDSSKLCWPYSTTPLLLHCCCCIAAAAAVARAVPSGMSVPPLADGSRPNFIVIMTDDQVGAALHWQGAAAAAISRISWH